MGAGMWTANETQADGVHYAGRLGREELAEVMRGAEGLVFVPCLKGLACRLSKPSLWCSCHCEQHNGDARGPGRGCGIGRSCECARNRRGDEAAETDRSLRNRAIEAGLMRAEAFSWDASAQRLMASIEKVIAAHA